MNIFLSIAAGCLLLACNNASETDKQTADSTASAQQTVVVGSVVALPAPYATESANNQSSIVGWEKSTMPVAPQGFGVTLFADSLESPRNVYVAPNGDIFIAQADRAGKKGNNIILFKDANKDGVPESKSVYLEKLKQPYGMLVLGNKFYVANTDALLEFPYDAGSSMIKSSGKKLASFPTGRHWTRNIISNEAGDKIYIAVGSASNVAEDGMDKEVRRANILAINTDGSNEKVFASGLRNPVGMDWAPGTGTLWTAVNERDELGDDLVPDYITSVKEGGFYGWPYSYFGQHEDPRIKGDIKRPDLVQKAIVPDVAVGSHTAALGLAFYRGNSFPDKYKNGAFVSMHGSWNRSHLSGYKVMFVPFSNGKPSGKPEDFLTGFIANEEKSEVYGRPVDIALLPDGSVLVTDDGDGKIWRVSYSK